VGSDRLDLRGRVCLVTGAAQGIGLVTARELVERGACTVVVVDSDDDALRAAAAGLGERAAAMCADVADGDAMRSVIALTLERCGRLDVVVANAGIERVGTVRTQPADVFERVIEVNFLGSPEVSVGQLTRPGSGGQ
jgi:NAD(P)-dependent dehydrogenase (short-subunit alcohol dehydrogenase family)